MTTLVIDAGSSSVRALLFDQKAQPIPGAMARREHRFSADSTADAAVMRELVETCIDEILGHPAASTITAVGMAVFAGNLLGVDANHQPITPIYTYADTRSSEDSATLAQKHDMQAVHARTGCRIHPAYHPAKLHWLRRTQRALFARVACWTDFATYCYSTWFGYAVPCSYSIASWSGLLDRAGLVWDSTWLASLDLDTGHLPELGDYCDVQHGLQSAYASRWPLLQDVPFYLAVGDGVAANIGSGGVSADRPVLTVGTTAAVRIVTRDPGHVPPGLWAYRVDAERYLVGGATSEGGNIFAWIRDTLRLDMAQLDEALLQREPGAHGLTVLPLLAGERSPGYHGDAVGVVHGLQLDTSPLDICHALLEGVALRLRLIYDLLPVQSEFVLAGGGALTQSPAWAQIIADLLGVPLHMVDSPEASARGIVLLVNQHSHGMQPAEPKISRVFSPRASMSSRIRDVIARHVDLYYAFYGTQ